MRQKCGLSVVCKRQLFRWSVKAEGAQRESQRFIDFGECVARLRKRLGEILPHSRFLRALAREQQHDVHALKADDHRRPRESRAESYEKHGAAFANPTFLYCLVDRDGYRSR